MIVSLLRWLRVGRLAALFGSFVAGCGGCGIFVAGAVDQSHPVAIEHADLVRVIDGDTMLVAIAGRTTSVRLLGIDAPESSGTRYGAPDCGGQSARDFLQGLVSQPAATRLTLIRDGAAPATDRYGRLLRYVKLRGHRRTLEESVLEAGWAQTYFLDQRLQRASGFRRAAARGRNAGGGTYAECHGDFHSARS
jgi:endonuclease YncB( thermonuclease family)